MKKASPPWQVVDLVSHRLDPQTLATASCVSKSWLSSMSADHLWQPICSAAFPSLVNLRSAAPVSYRKLYSLGRAAEKRRLQKPTKPHLSLNDLIFAFDIQNGHGCVSTVILPGGQLKLDKNNQGRSQDQNASRRSNDVFRFDIDVERHHTVAFNEFEDLRVTWNVVLQGFEGVFMMMDCSGKGSFVLGLEGWFSKELPSAGCCSSGGGSGMVADLRVGLRESGGKVVVEKMSVGVLSIVSWRYVCVDDALRYLQHFLFPTLY